MSALRSALQRRVLNIRILYGIPQCLERHRAFNSFYISRLAHTSAKNGESGNTSRSAQKSQPGYNKPKVIIRGSTGFNSTPSHPTDTFKNWNYFTPKPPEHCRIFVGGLSKFTTEESMRAYFCKFGSVKHCGIDRDEYGISKKRGYVDFEFNDQTSRAVESIPHIIDGQEVGVRHWYNSSDHKKNRIIVRGLPQETSQMTLQNFYSQFGEIIHCHVVRDHRNISRGYAFVSFKSGEAMDLALNSLPHRIDGKEISDVQQARDDRKRELTFRVFDLSPETTEESLREFYSKFGQLTRCELHLTSKTKLRYGNVAFSSQKELDHALDAEPHIIDGSKVFLKYLTSELDLCIQAVPEDISIESLQKFFSKYGVLRDCRFNESSTGPKYAHLHFASIDAVNRALADRPHIVEGKLVKITFANKTRESSFTLIVESLPENVTEKSLVETFSKFGKLVYWKVYNGNLSRSNPYGSVSYGTPEEVLNALNNGPHMIEGVTLDVRKETETTVHRRISVAGLSKFTNEESMRAYFCKFGTVKHCGIDREPYTRISKKTGYVEFESNDQANRTVESFPHVIDGQEVNVFPYFNSSDFKKNQIIVRGLSRKISQMTLRNFYSQFGQVLSCNISRDERNVSRGYAFVSFKSGEAMDLALNSLPHSIDGKEISDVQQARGDCKRELTLCVYHLSPETTEESLREFYSKFGRLTRCNLTRNPNTGALQRGIVAFETQEELNNALEAEPHVIDGAKVFLTYLTSELDLCVRAIPEGVTKKSLEKFFSKYGELRGFRFEKTLSGNDIAYVHYSTLDAVDSALADRPHIVEGKLINTTFANKTRQAAFTLLVGSLPDSVTEKSLAETFSKFGKLVYWKIHNDGNLSGSNPYGCVSYGTPEEALNALNNGPHMMEGMSLDVRKENEPPEHCRIFIAGLSKFTTEESMRAYFRKFGTVKHCGIDREPYTGISKNTGYVEFESDDQANLAIEHFSHVIDGQEVDVRPYFNSNDHKKNQIIVRGLLQETSQMTLRNFYSQFGEITHCNISRDEGNISRGYAFVSFKSGEAVDFALNSLPHRIEDKEISNVQRTSVNKRELTLRVFDLSSETTEESLREFYSRFGHLTRCDLFRNPNTGALQRGIVAFEIQEELDHALKAEPHVIDGSKVFLTYLTSELDLCVKVVPQGVTKESFEKFFSKYGDLRGCRFRKTRSGNDIAFVHYSTLDAVDSALADRPHIVEGKLVNTTFASKAKQATFSLFVGSFPESATENSLVETFSKFGKLVHWQLRDDGKLNQSTPYGFVSYGTAEEALTALNSGPHLIKGTTLDVRKAREMVAESDRKSED